MNEPEQPDFAYHEIHSLRDSAGWRAVFVERHLLGFPYLAEEPLIGWATVHVHGVFEQRQADIVVDTEVIGLVARDEVIEAPEADNFMGYLGPGEDRNVYLDDIPEALARAEAEEQEEEGDHPDASEN